jgi:ABC-type maltose transport system permease subunit
LPHFTTSLLFNRKVSNFDITVLPLAKPIVVYPFVNAFITFS